MLIIGTIRAAIKRNMVLDKALDDRLKIVGLASISQQDKETGS